MSGSVRGVGSDRHLVLYYWVIPNRNIRMVSVSILVRCEDWMLRVEIVWSVGVMDVSSLVVLRARLRWFFLRVFLLRTVGLFHRRYK